MISIIIPTYNRAHLLPRVIESVLNQTYRHWELIIADDGSTDNTRELISVRYKDERIKYFYKDNSGSAHIRNVGAANASGDYLVFLDSDDLVMEHWLEQIVPLINQASTNILCCGVQYEKAGGEVTGLELPNKHSELFGDKDFQLFAGSFFIPKQYFSDVGGYDVNLRARQHTDLWVRLFDFIRKKNIDITCIYTPLVRIIEHSGERVTGNYKGVFEGMKALMGKYPEKFKRSPKLSARYYFHMHRCLLKMKDKKMSRSYLIRAIRADYFNIRYSLHLVRLILKGG